MRRFMCAAALAAGIASMAYPAGAGIGGDAIAARAASFAEHQATCAGKTGWSDPAPPVRIFANVYDVGTCGIVVLLIAGPAGDVMIDGATAQAAPAILANLQRLGVRPGDVRRLLSSHEHFDHAGGLQAIRRATGARLLASAAARPVLASGVAAPDDPQKSGLSDFPAVPVDGIVRDGDVVAVGPLRLTAHMTPGHAAGSTSWSWTSCEGAICRMVVFADSLRATPAGAYRFGDHPAYVATFRASIAKVAGLPCDLVITPHPDASHLYERMAGAMPLSDPRACVAYAATHAAKLDERLAGEGAAAH